MEAEGNGMSLSVPVKVNKDTTRNVTIFLSIPILIANSRDNLLVGIN